MSLDEIDLLTEGKILAKKIAGAKDPDMPNYFAGTGIMTDGRVTLACHGSKCSTILAWEGLDKLPDEIIEWDWNIAQLTKEQWTHIIMTDFDMIDMISNISRIPNVWKNINVILKGSAKRNDKEMQWNVPQRILRSKTFNQMF